MLISRVNFEEVNLELTSIGQRKGSLSMVCISEYVTYVLRID